MPIIGPTPREPRRSVALTASLRAEGPRREVMIRNLSSRGMMLVVRGGSPPPPCGTFVDVRRGPLTLVGQVRWRSGNRIGVRLQDAVDPALLVKGRAMPPTPRAPIAASMTTRPPADRSRSIAAALQFASMAILPLALVACAGWLLFDLAAGEIRQLLAALG